MSQVRILSPRPSGTPRDDSVSRSPGEGPFPWFSGSGSKIGANRSGLAATVCESLLLAATSLDGIGRKAVLAALQLGAQKWESITLNGDRKFRPLCVELAVEHGFKLENPELQREVAPAKERALPERPFFPRARVWSIADAYRLHLEEVVHESAGPKRDSSRFDSEVAVRLRLTGHHRDAIVRAIREGGPASRPHERHDWDAYARRVVDFAFGVPGSLLARSLEAPGNKGRRLAREPARGRRSLDL
jgi:Large polyvalent protein-associated domain 7